MEDLNGQVIALILFVVIGAIQWLIKKIKGENEDEISDEYKELYEEYREEIIEQQAELRQPTSVGAPPPLPEQLAISESITYQAPAPAVEYHAPTISTSPSYKEATPAELSAEEQAAAERFLELGKKKKHQSSASDASITARALLADPQSARQAVILQEIFGKPRSMQEM